MSEEINEVKTKDKKRPIYKKWWFWVILIVAFAIIIGSVIGGTSKSNSQNPSSNKEPTKDPETTADYIGDKVTSGSVEFTVTNVYDTKLLGSSVVGEETQNNFIVIEIDAKNVGNS